jgi:hypothetical protein
VRGNGALSVVRGGNGGIYSSSASSGRVASNCAAKPGYNGVLRRVSTGLPLRQVITRGSRGRRVEAEETPVDRAACVADRTGPLAGRVCSRIFSAIRVLFISSGAPRRSLRC